MLEMWKFRPNPSYDEGQILSLFINGDKKVTETFQLIDPYLVIIFHSSVYPSVSQLLAQGKFIKEPYQECSEKCFQIIAQGLDL